MDIFLCCLHHGDLCALPYPRSSPSESQGLCALVLALRGLVCTGISFLGVHSASRGLCGLVSLPMPPSAWSPGLHALILSYHLTSGGYMFSGLCQEVCVHCPILYASPLSTPRPWPLHWGLCTSCVCMPATLG